ncbi:unnamed protein product [Closterium sp. Naga37s-1]|nr:unnamed protein product [Closterium sp. Naga37s-1]
MLVVFTGRLPFVEADESGQLVTKWTFLLTWLPFVIFHAQSTPAGVGLPLLGGLDSLKHPTMDAPADAVMRVAQLALSCTAERTAARPSMAHVANELQAIREEVVGKEELSAAVKVDVQVKEKEAVASVLSLDEQLQFLDDNLAEGKNMF